MMPIKRVTALVLCTLGLSFACITIGQASPDAGRNEEKNGQPAANRVGDQPQWKNIDQKLATCMAIGNLEEVVMAQFAETRAHDNEVKEFASKLLKDHREILAKLHRFAPEAAREGYLTELDKVPAAETQRSTAAEADQKPATNPVPQTGEKNPKDQIGSTVSNLFGQIGAAQIEVSSSTSIDFAQLHREVAEECMRSAKSRLNEKSGTEFDQAFIANQLARHSAMKAQLVVFQRRASANLRPIIVDSLEMTEMHLQRAEQIMKHLRRLERSEPDSVKTSSLK